jgi:glucokinase
MSRENLFVGIDVGGQSIKGGVVDDAGRPRSSVTVPTEVPKGQEHGLGQMALAVRLAAEKAGLALADIAAIGVATPGLMDIPAGIMTHPVNFPGWENVPVRQFIADTFGKPTAFQNDANAAGYGEYCFGAGRELAAKGRGSLVHFTLGTGIGCGIIINGAILEGEHSTGAEAGHIIVEATNGRLCGCGRPGHLEAYASATGLVARTLERLSCDPTPSQLREEVQKLDEMEARHVRLVFDAARAGDALARRLVEETAHYLAVGAVCMMHTIDPDLVVFGGGMTRTGDWFLELIRQHIRWLAFPVPAAKTQVVFSKLGPEDAGFIGAAACARQLVARPA